MSACGATSSLESVIHNESPRLRRFLPLIVRREYIVILDNRFHSLIRDNAPRLSRDDQNLELIIASLHHFDNTLVQRRVSNRVINPNQLLANSLELQKERRNVFTGRPIDPLYGILETLLTLYRVWFIFSQQINPHLFTITIGAVLNDGACYALARQ